MTRPRLLDLFCGQGGASHGYALAGFEVVGVDVKDQPRYPYEFHKADAMTYPLDGFEAYAASPPCNDHSPLSHFVGAQGTAWMLTATIERLRATGRPYVVENVEGADMPGALTLCGTEFGLQTRRDGRLYALKRHRQFVSNLFLMGAGGCTCGGLAPAMGVYGNGGGQFPGRGVKARVAEGAELLGVDWMNVKGQAQAIPPAYTRFIGEQLLAHLAAR